MNKLRSQVGSIAVLVTITLFFFVIILGGTYTAVYMMQKTQLESDLQIKKIYENDVDSVDAIYENIIESKEDT